MSHDVFISYSSKDKDVAGKAWSELQAAGVKCWIAAKDITVSSDYGEDIIRAIDQSRIMVLIFSSSTQSSRQVLTEVSRAFDKDLIIVTLRIEDVGLSEGFIYRLGAAQWWDASTSNLDGRLRELARSIKSRLESLKGAGIVSASEQKPFIVEPVPSPALTPELDSRIQNTLKSFRDYLVNAGFKITSSKLRYEIVPGDFIQTDDGQFYSLFDMAADMIQVASKFAANMDSFLHEYMRYVLTMDYEEIPNPYQNKGWWMHQAINSGLSVYFPCSFKGDPVFAEPSRQVQNNLYKYGKFNKQPTDMDSADSIGRKAWGSAFWELRNHIGGADKLLASTWTSWRPFEAKNIARSFVTKLVKTYTDQGGENAKRVEDIFSRRGLKI